MENLLKKIHYKKVGQVTGMVLLDTLFAGAIFYILYYLFSIPLVWTVLVAVASLLARSGMLENRD